MSLGPKKKHYSVYLSEDAYKRLKLLALHSKSRSFSDLVERFSEGDPRVIQLAAKLWKYVCDADWDPSNGPQV